MATYKVIKSHDGLREGAIITAPSTSIQNVMVKLGYWERIDTPSEAVKTEDAKPTHKRSKGGRKAA